MRISFFNELDSYGLERLLILRVLLKEFVLMSELARGITIPLSDMEAIVFPRILNSSLQTMKMYLKT